MLNSALSTRPAAPPQMPDFQNMVTGIQREDPNAMSDLYSLMQKGIKFMVQQRMCGREQHVEDRVHEVYLITVRAIREGKVREPDHLAGFVRTVAVRQVCDEIRRAGVDRRRSVPADSEMPVASTQRTPEEIAIENERHDRMRRTLQSLKPRDREILRRFYLDGQEQEQICEEMSLTETQFRLLKSRAKARFAELGKRSMERPRAAS